MTFLGQRHGRLRGNDRSQERLAARWSPRPSTPHTPRKDEYLADRLKEWATVWPNEAADEVASEYNTF